MAAGCPGEDALMRTVSSSAMDADPAWATAGDREAVPRLESQRSLRLRPGLMSQASLGGNEAASLLRSGSFKVDVKTAPTSGFDGQTPTASRSVIRTRLEDLDGNGDGVIDKEDLITFIEQTISTEKRLRHMSWLAAALTAFLLLFAGTTFGLTWTVVDMAKDSQSLNGAWADRDSYDTLRTAFGGFMELNFTRELTPAAVRASVPGVHDDPPGVRYEVVDLSQLPAAAGAAAGAESAAKADDAVAADGVARPDAAQQQQQDALAAGVDEVDAEGGVNFDSPGGRRRLLQSRGPPIGTVARENAETACLWLTEGNININIKVLDAFGSHFPAGTAHVAEAQGCRDLHNNAGLRGKPELTGTLVYHKTTYTILCKKHAERCSIRYAPHSGPSALRTKNGRRLQAADGSGTHPLVESGCPPVEVGGALQPVAELSDGTCPNCFPAGAGAEVRGRGRVPLSQLAVGDTVQVVEEDGNLGWSEVYLFPHFLESGDHAFLRVTTDADASITLSADHYLYTAPGPEAPFSARVATPTAAVAPGALLWRRVGGNGTAERPVAGESPAVLLLERVAAVETVTAAGLVNPFTLRGNIVVDGVAASIYNDAMAGGDAGPAGEARMHAFTALGRALWRSAPAVLRWAHDARAAQPISIAIGRFFARNLKPATPGHPALHWAAVRLAKF